MASSSSLSVGTLDLEAGIVSDQSGSISFETTNLSTTGTLSAGNITTPAIYLAGKSGAITRSKTGAIDLDTLADNGNITYTAIGAVGAHAFRSGFANLGAGFAPAAFVVRQFSNNGYHVSLEGCVRSLDGNGAAAVFPANSVIFTLPLAYAPKKGTCVFRCAAQDNIDPNVPGSTKLDTTMRVDISTSGDVTVNPNNSGPVDANGNQIVDLVFLSNISYYVVP